MKNLIDVVYAFINLFPFKVQMKHIDRYRDHSLVVVAGFGLTAAYVRTPDGEITSQWQRGDIQSARRLGYVMHQTQFARWIKRSSSEDLLDARDAESSSIVPDLTLINAIQRELDLRMGFSFRKAA